jgi:DNA mismatch repair protein MutH
VHVSVKSAAPHAAAIQHVALLSEAALLARAGALAGRRLDELCALHGARAGKKGRVGVTLERALGVEQGSARGADLPGLGIEIKTLPVAHGRVLESTWVGSATPSTLAAETWATSLVRSKLARVLWLPVEAGPIAASERRVGTAFLWSPDAQDEATLRADWEDLADLVSRALGFAVSARRGTALQLRPKARDASVRVRASSESGERVQIAPQGFYLRRTFTQAIVDRVFGGSARS